MPQTPLTIERLPRHADRIVKEVGWSSIVFCNPPDPTCLTQRLFWEAIEEDEEKEEGADFGARETNPRPRSEPQLFSAEEVNNLAARAIRGQAAPRSLLYPLDEDAGATLQRAVKSMVQTTLLVAVRLSSDGGVRSRDMVEALRRRRQQRRFV